jgi:AcrR family transcriptional regulator
MPAVKTHTSELKAALIDEAGRVLRTEGTGALTLRRLAQATGTSTAAVYSLFGDKSGLLEHMYLEGFERLARTVSSVAPAGDPLDVFVAIGRAYRRAALRSPDLYELMFGRPVPGFSPSTDARRAAAKSFRPVVDAIARCVGSGAFDARTDPEAAAHHLWALAHGLVALELHGTLPLSQAEYGRRYLSAIGASLSAYLPGATAWAPGPGAAL